MTKQRDELILAVSRTTGLTTANAGTMRRPIAEARLGWVGCARICMTLMGMIARVSDWDAGDLNALGENQFFWVDVDEVSDEVPQSGAAACH